ncbi:MAG: hypothetical protein K2L72_04580, partial [Clostridia bacterium]|nr:hypothetical protein [Clostridia bacterium]
QDIDKVRKIRDILEYLECEPIVFFLKCLDDDDANLEEFLKKEIEARNVFLYCKSQNSEKSKWVQKELEYIQAFDKARCYEIDIENDFSLNIIDFLQMLSEILRRNRIVVTYTPSEQEIGDRITGYCRSLGFKAKSIYEIRKEIYGTTDSYKLSEEKVQREIDRYVNEGVFMWLISPTSAKKSSRYDRFPEYAYESYERGGGKGLILPIVVKSSYFHRDYYLIPECFRNFEPCVINVEDVENGLCELGKRLREIGLNTIYAYKKDTAK